MFELKEKDKSSLTWRFTDTARFPDVYEVTMSVCAGVFCKCMEMDLGFKSVLMDKPFSIVVELRECGICAGAGMGDKHPFFDQFAKEINQADWDMLLGRFLGIKYELTREYKTDDEEQPDFDENDVENGGMVEYKEVFPWDSKFQFVIDDVAYQILDQYCIGNHHDCGEAAVFFAAIKDNKQFLFGRDIPMIEFDTKKKTWNNGTKTPAQPHGHAVLIEILLREYPDAFDVFVQRHAKLRTLYKKYLRGKRSVERAAMIESKPKPGRNDPCPCGSGKKFKKCCGGTG